MASVVLGVTGGIACYKSAALVSSLVKKDIDVDVIMTENAAKFVTPLTFQTLSRNPVTTDTFGSIKYWEVEHIALAKKADVMVKEKGAELKFESTKENIPVFADSFYIEQVLTNYITLLIHITSGNLLENILLQYCCRLSERLRKVPPEV